MADMTVQDKVCFNKHARWTGAVLLGVSALFTIAVSYAVGKADRDEVRGVETRLAAERDANLELRGDLKVIRMQLDRIEKQLEREARVGATLGSTN